MTKNLSLIVIVKILVNNLPVIYGLSFLTRPENKTFQNGQVFSLNCSINISLNTRIDWFFTSLLRPNFEHHVVQWNHKNEYVVEPGFTAENPDIQTSNLVIRNPSSSSAGKYCCQDSHRHLEKSCAFAREISIPQNEVVLAGNSVMLNCAQVQAFRWYRYKQTDLFDDKVIYMGSRMADDVDERFRVYTEPDQYPFDRLDLYISNVQRSLFGTYKCQQLRHAHCAEIIVLESEPVCDVHLVNKLGIIVTEAELSCKIKITENVEPEMICRQNATGYQTQTNCPLRRNGIVTCTTQVARKLLSDIVCTIRFNAKPLQMYSTCTHVSNQPSYTFSWMPSTDELFMLSSMQLSLIAVLSAFIIVCIILFAKIVEMRRRNARDVCVDSSDTLSTESELLSESSEEKFKADVESGYVTYSGMPQQAVS